MYGYCKTCGQWSRPDTHKCPPPWRVFIKDQHDHEDPADGVVVYARDAEDAAEKGVDEWDSADGERQYVGEEAIVCVRPEGRDGEAEWFAVTGEWYCSYGASEIEPPS